MHDKGRYYALNRGRMDVVGWIIGLIGLGAACYWGQDARTRRAKSDRLLQHQAETIRELYGFLYGMRGWATIDAGKVNDRLQYISQRDAKFARIEKGEE